MSQHKVLTSYGAISKLIGAGQYITLISAMPLYKDMADCSFTPPVNSTYTNTQ